jgi:hypothetical protein
MEPVPEEYTESVLNASAQLSNAAKTVMFVAEMLGHDVFELDTAEGFTIIIKKNKEL